MSGARGARMQECPRSQPGPKYGSRYFAGTVPDHRLQLSYHGGEAFKRPECLVVEDDRSGQSEGSGIGWALHPSSRGRHHGHYVCQMLPIVVVARQTGLPASVYWMSRGDAILGTPPSPQVLAMRCVYPIPTGTANLEKACWRGAACPHTPCYATSGVCG